VLVQNGTLRVGDIVVSGQAYGRVKAMYDTLDDSKRVDEAGPSVPVNLTGLNRAPSAGSRFYVLDDIARAREIADARAAQERSFTLGAIGFQHVTLENLFDRLEHTGEAQTLNIILRADVRGSIEAIEKEFSKLVHPEVKIKLLQKSVGGITEADVTLAHASDAIIIGFNVVPDENARARAEATGVQIRRYDVIYKITEGRAGPGPGAAGVQDQPRRHGGRLPRLIRHGRARRPGPRDPRQHHHWRLSDRDAAARKGRRQRSSRRLRVRHQAGRLQ
jgi:translation initiation factor IF-2